MTLHEALNRQVANAMVLYMKLHNYHWYVSGGQFFTLHEKFEQLYDEFAAYIDSIAERLLMIGGQPVSTLAAVLEKTSLKEESNTRGSAEQMVQSVVDDFQQVISELQQGGKLAAESDDEVTVDLLLGMQSSLEKHVWLLQSFLGK